MKSLIIGKGQVGEALYNVLVKRYGKDIFIRDKDREALEVEVNILHICFPYSKTFEDDVTDYVMEYLPDEWIIHSTVPVGTSAKLKAYYSPIRGKHPLEKGIMTFIKYLAPPDRKLKKYFEDAGIKIRQIKKTQTLEAMKLWDTAQYGWNIILEKLIEKYCEKNKLDFNLIYKEANETYNEGYGKLGMGNVIRPILKHMKGKIGGHCIIQNCDLLESEISDIIRRINRKL